VDGGRRSEGGGGPVEESILALLEDLVRLPSRAAGDDPGRALARVRDWMRERDLPCEDLLDERGTVVALTGTCGGGAQPAYFLNATIDTAGFGDPSGWRLPPTAARIEDGRLYGRGSGDSKAGVAIFCHVFERLHRSMAGAAHGLGYVFDAEEHSGRFTGMRRFVETCAPPPAGVIIGYPGFDRIVTGARGFYRATLRLHGEAAHSGSSSGKGVNAVAKAAALVARLAAAAEQFRARAGSPFPLPPKLTVTRVAGGGEFSLVPDLCEVDVDIRLTPAFDAGDAEDLLRAAAAEIEAVAPAPPEPEIVVHGTYPAYLLPDGSPLRRAVGAAALKVLGRELPTGPCGPSNVGNLLATLGIEALCGFGVRAGGVHGFDEWIDISTIRPVFEVYCEAVARLLGEPLGEGRWDATTWERKSFA
jgi:succinyl-diaminopimelate desuccinylase